jgi:hypothetical protein
VRGIDAVVSGFARTKLVSEWIGGVDALKDTLELEDITNRCCGLKSSGVHEGALVRSLVLMPLILRAMYNYLV